VLGDSLDSCYCGCGSGVGVVYGIGARTYKFIHYGSQTTHILNSEDYGTG
jgi:hypothetical protein